VQNKTHPEDSIAEGYISEECMVFSSRFLKDVHTKLSHLECHESTAMNEPPSRLSVFGNIDYSKKGFIIKKVDSLEMQQMRHYIITNCDEATLWVK
jgi:hypothetical protein